METRPEEHPERGAGGDPERIADGHPGRTGGPHLPAFVTGGGYALLFLFGAAQGVIGCFQFSWGAGPVPLAALGFCAAILVTCLLGAAGMGSAAGALVVAAGWFLASAALTLPTSQGSVIVTNTAAGEWYLYGGTACVLIALVIVFVRRSSRGRPPGVPAPRVPAPGQPPRGAGP